MINTIVSAIQELCQKLLPFRMIKETQFGIRWTGGRFGKLAQGEFLWCIPVLQEIEVLDATIAGFFPPVQCVSTSDNQAVAIRVGLEWRIIDAHEFTMLAGENDFEEILAVIVQSSVASIISKLPLGEIILRQKPVETQITNQIAKMIKEYGIEIKRAHVVELVPVFPVKLYQDANVRAVSSLE